MRVRYILVMLTLVIVMLLVLQNTAVAAPELGGGGGIPSCETVKFTSVRLRNVVCVFKKYCGATVSLFDGPREYVTQVNGWSLSNDQYVNVSARVCTDGGVGRAKIVK